MMKHILFLMIFTLIETVSSLPTSKYTFMIEKPFHPANFETILLKEEDLVVKVTKDLKPDSHDFKHIVRQWFHSLLQDDGTFQSMDRILGGSPLDGSLKYFSKAQSGSLSNPKTTFSIVNGELTHEGIRDFTLCRVSDDSYSVHISKGVNIEKCGAMVDGVKVKVLNQFGIQASDFDEPEFIYNTGELMFL